MHRTRLPLLATVALLAVAAVLTGCARGPDGGVEVGMPRYVVQQSGSMEPTLQIGQRLRAWPVPEDIERGSILVVRFPDTDNKLPKRVVGLPGERVANRGGQVTIDGRPLDEPYLAGGVATEGIEAVQLGPDEYFLLGDNRPNSQDSRSEGPFPVRSSTPWSTPELIGLT